MIKRKSIMEPVFTLSKDQPMKDVFENINDKLNCYAGAVMLARTHSNFGGSNLPECEKDLVEVYRNLNPLLKYCVYDNIKDIRLFSKTKSLVSLPSGLEDHSVTVAYRRSWLTLKPIVTLSFLSIRQSIPISVSYTLDDII